MTQACIRLVTKNDRSGNPRRVFVVFNCYGIIKTVDEGYRGYNALYEDVPDFPRNWGHIESFETTPREYLRLVRMFNPAKGRRI